jgi:hypothetical protein
VNKRLLERLQKAWTNLTNREKLIAAALGAVIAISAFALPLLYLTGTNTGIEEEIDQLKKLGVKIGARKDKLVESTREKRAAERRYQQKAPPLGGFLETLAREQNLTIREVTDQPEKDFGQYHRRNVRILIANAPLSPLVNLMSAVETSRYPLAIEYLQLEHYQPGDSYQLKLGVVTFDKEGARESGLGDEETETKEEELPEETKETK